MLSSIIHSYKIGKKEKKKGEIYFPLIHELDKNWLAFLTGIFAVGRFIIIGFLAGLEAFSLWLSRLSHVPLLACGFAFAFAWSLFS